MKKMAIGDIKPREDDDPHSILEDSSSDDDNDNDSPRHPPTSPTRQDCPSSSQEPPPISQDTQDQVEDMGEVQSHDDPTSTIFGRRTRTSTIILLILCWVIPKGVQGLAASNTPHFANIMLLSLL
jgi:hypothetical protein